MSESLEKELRAMLVTFALEYHRTLYTPLRSEDNLKIQASRENLLDHTVKQFHSHMKTAFDEVIGENEDDRWVDINGNTVQSWEDAINKESRNDLRKEQRTRAAKYLSTIQVKGGVKVEPPLKRKVNDE